MQKTKVPQTKRPHFVDRNEQVKETIFELKLINTSETFLVDKSLHNNNSVF